MNDVNIIMGASSPLLAKTKRSEAAVVSSLVVFNKSESNSTANSVPRDAKAVSAAVAQINDYVQHVQRDLLFSVDDELGSTVVKVVDRSSGEVIRQIPNDVTLELARNLKDTQSIQLLEAMG